MPSEVQWLNPAYKVTGHTMPKSFVLLPANTKVVFGRINSLKSKNYPRHESKWLKCVLIEAESYRVNTVCHKGLYWNQYFLISA